MEESNTIVGSELETLKQTIADKDAEIAELSRELQTLQAQLQEVGKCQSEEEEEEGVHRLTVKTSDLRAKLLETEAEKQECERQLEATHQQMELLQQLTTSYKSITTSAVYRYMTIKHCNMRQRCLVKLFHQLEKQF